MAARARYLSEDRADIAFTANACCRGMAEPTSAHMALAKRLGRYLLSRPRVGTLYSWQEMPHELK
eukprot:2846122-Amphidinium_carterae.1